jgi:hypothetical protein
MLEVKQVWTGAEGETETYSVADDGTNVFAGMKTDPALVIKIDPANMTTVAETIVGAGDGRYVKCLIKVGNYLFAGFDWPFG